MARRPARPARIVRITAETYRALRARGRGFEGADDTIRRLVGLTPRPPQRVNAGGVTIRVTEDAYRALEKAALDREDADAILRRLLEIRTRPARVRDRSGRRMGGRSFMPIGGHAQAAEKEPDDDE